MSQKNGTNFLAEYISKKGLSTTIDSVQENKESVTFIWFDPNMGTVDETEKIKEDLRAVGNFVPFDFDIDSFKHCIKAKTGDKIFLIISANNAIKLLPTIEDIGQLDSIFIFPENREQCSHSFDDYPAFRGIFDNHAVLIKSIKNNIEYVNRQMEVVSFYDQHQQGTRDLSEESTKFLWFQLFTDVIQHLPQDNEAKKEMLTACREYYRGNIRYLADIDEFNGTYNIDQCISWYTREGFLYNMINKALRTEDIEQLYAFRFYITDLSKELAAESKAMKNEDKKEICLYRGTVVSKTEAEKIKANVDKLIATNGYWSTSRYHCCALTYAKKLKVRPDNVAILFEIECNLQDQNNSIIVADISNLSEFPEGEFLFNASSVFQIIRTNTIVDDNDEILVVKMRATEKASEITKNHIEDNRREMEDESPKIMYSTLLKRMGKLEKSLQYLEHLLENPDGENVVHIHNRIGIALKDQKKFDLALKHFDRTLYLISISDDASGRTYSAFVHHNKGLVYAQQKEFPQALRSYRKAVEIIKEEKEDANLNLAQFYNSIGRVYLNEEDYDRAFKFQRESLQLRAKCFPAGHVINAFNYNDIGDTYSHLEKYDDALNYQSQALKLREDSLPSDHHNTAWSLQQVGKLHHKKGNRQRALEYFEKSLGMTKRCFPNPQHRHAVPRILEYIAWIYGNKPKVALQYHLEALEVQQKTNPVDYSYLARILKNIGRAYKSMGRSDNSRNFFEQASKIEKENPSGVRLNLVRNRNHSTSTYEALNEMADAFELDPLFSNLFISPPVSKTTRKNIDRIKQQR